VATIASVAERGDESGDDDLDDDDDDLESLLENDGVDTEAGRTPSPAVHTRQSAASSVLEEESEMDEDAR
jgi:hypothetical protein